jgi:hypothetical protein
VITHSAYQHVRRQAAAMCPRAGPASLHAHRAAAVKRVTLHA